MSVSHRTGSKFLTASQKTYSFLVTVKDIYGNVDDAMQLISVFTQPVPKIFVNTSVLRFSSQTKISLSGAITPPPRYPNTNIPPVVSVVSAVVS